MPCPDSSGEKMKNGFDMFWFGENGPNWVDAVETLQTAKEQIEKLPQNDSGSYAVVDHRTGNRLSFATKLRARGARNNQGFLSYGSALFFNAKENSQNISVLRSSSDLQIVVVHRHRHTVQACGDRARRRKLQCQLEC